MIKMYEDACREAGLTEEETRRIRGVFESDRKKLKYRNKQIEKYGFFAFYFSASAEMEKMVFNIPDPHPTPEEDCIHQLELKRLRSALEDFSLEDRELLMAFFDKETPFTDYVRSVGGDRSKMIRRKDALLRELRKKMADLF